MDKEYWNQYYEKNFNNKEIINPSSFALFCQNNYFSHSEKKILELGCGNGRDSLFFTRQGHTVSAIDQSNTINLDQKKLSVIVSDFIKYDYTKLENINVIYSRFTLHSISLEDEEILLKKIENKLDYGGIFCVEARTIKDPLYGIGNHISDTTYETDHKRRFIDAMEFIRKIFNMGFSLKYFIESNGLSVYKNDDPVLMRLIAIKNNNGKAT